MNKQIRAGVILSYILLFVNTVYGLLVTPYILKYVGNADYGVYKSVSSISASLAVMDLGFGGTMTRYMAKFHATGEKDKACNFAAMIFVQVGIVAFAVLGVGTVLTLFVDKFYAKTFSADEIALARTLLAILTLNLVLRLIENLFFGIANGNERFTFSNSVKLISVILKFSLIFVFLPIVKNVVLIALSETAIVTASLILYVIYTRKTLHIYPRLKKWDSVLFKESFGYTSLMFIQTITIQFNGNVDNILIGTNISAASVTVYSMALLVFGMYESLSGSVATVMLPNITQKVVAGQSGAELQKTVEKAGRFQFMLLAAALGGFAALGREFYALWLGDGFGDCYLLTLILIIPVTISMVQNVSLSVLRAQNRMVYRTVTLAVSCTANCLITVIGIKLWGYWGAAIGTATATIMNLIFMNIYYKKQLHFHISKMLFNIMHRILPCAAVATVLTSILHFYLKGSWMFFAVNVAAFMVMYLAGLHIFGLSDEEKTMLYGKFRRRKA